MWSQSGLPNVPGWNAGNGDHVPTGNQDWANFYQSMPANQVDWGSLAQQWIAMKTENTIPPQTFDDAEPPPPAPGEEQFTNRQPLPTTTYNQWPPVHLPPPNIHTQETTRQHDEAPPLPPAPPLPSTPHPNIQPEGGVVDMDMDDEDEQTSSSTGINDWSQSNSSLKANITADGYYAKQTEIPINKGVNTSNREYQRPTFGGPSPHPPGGGWIHKNNQGAARGLSNSHMTQIQPLMGLSSNSTNMADSHAAYNTQSYNSTGMMGSMANLDAAARKKLPPWIREGLEKMEREKLKKEEELMRKMLREEKLRKRREEELKMDEKRKQDPGVSKFDDMNSDSESNDDNTDHLNAIKPNLNDLSDNESGINDNETNGKVSEGNTISHRKRPSRFDENSSVSRNNVEEQSNTENKVPKKEAPKKHLTKDEILEEMSFILKRTLTEILLEVTTEEIHATAEESLASAQRQKSKSVLNAKIRANRAFKKNPISSLGLTGYGSGTDDSASDSEKSVQKSEDDTSDSDSDVELEERLKQRKRQFQRTETSILDECADLEKNLEKRERIWKEREIDSGRRRHESKSSNHSDNSEHRRNSSRVFETFSAAVGGSETTSVNIESRVLKYEKEDKIVNSEQIRIPSPSHSKIRNLTSKFDPDFNEKNYSSDENKTSLRIIANSDSAKDKKVRHGSDSAEEKQRDNERSLKQDSKSKERRRRSPSDANDSDKSEKVRKSKRSRSKEKTSKKSRSPKRSRSPKSSRSPYKSKYRRNSRSRSRSRDRSEKKSSRRDRHRSRSKEKNSRDSKTSSSRRKRSTSRETRRSIRSRSRSREKRRHRRRHSSTSSETSNYSYASGSGHHNRKEKRDSEKSSRKSRRRSRS